jgi:hypothetical protein
MPLSQSRTGSPPTFGCLSSRRASSLCTFCIRLSGVVFWGRFMAASWYRMNRMPDSVANWASDMCRSLREICAEVVVAV